MEHIVFEHYTFNFIIYTEYMTMNFYTYTLNLSSDLVELFSSTPIRAPSQGSTSHALIEFLPISTNYTPTKIVDERTKNIILVSPGVLDIYNCVML